MNRFLTVLRDQNAQTQSVQPAAPAQQITPTAQAPVVPVAPAVAPTTQVTNDAQPTTQTQSTIPPELKAKMDDYAQKNKMATTRYQNALALIRQTYGPQAAEQIHQQAKQPVAQWNPPPQQQTVQQGDDFGDLRSGDLTPLQQAELTRRIIREEMSTFEQKATQQMSYQQSSRVAFDMIKDTVADFDLSHDEGLAIRASVEAEFEPDELRTPRGIERYGQRYREVAYLNRVTAMLNSGQITTAQATATVQQQLTNQQIPTGQAPNLTPTETPQQARVREMLAAQGSPRVNKLVEGIKPI